MQRGLPGHEPRCLFVHLPMRLADSGYSLVELMLAMAMIATLSAIAIPRLTTSLDDHRALGAARYLSTRFHRTRMEAITRSNEVALRFARVNGHYSYTPHADGNGNGVRNQDIANGVDRPIGPSEKLADQFTGVDFGVLAGLPAVESGAAPPGDDPIKLGASNLLSFSANGTSSTGSVYVRGRHSQYVVRIYGVTAKTRVLKFWPDANQWRPL